MKKDRFYNAYKIPKSTTPPNAKVLARRNFHIRMAEWMGKWLSIFHIAAILIGLIVILAPMLSPAWRTIVESTALTREVLIGYSTFNAVAIVNIAILAILAILRELACTVMPSLRLIVGYKGMIDNELLPSTQREEIAFIFSMLHGISSSSAWLIFPFGLLAFLINLNS